MPRSSTGERFEVNDPPWKGVIRMIVVVPAGGDSQRARKAQVQGAHRLLIKEMIDVEVSEDTPLIQFGRAEHSEPRVSCNDALVITAVIGFAEEVVHPRGMISLPLIRGETPLRRTCLLKFQVVDIPSAYNVILGRLALNTFRTVISSFLWMADR
ncbi:UNVERIFIED_CONTAM: hypothetical protein Sradi_3583800 [Sesamum radiatum]|uniref:Uncharacterized protein n=1 Tax=Sesamum radiatum TaxID=300843 RepID=A0AAW2QGF7_SESRA